MIFDYRTLITEFSDGEREGIVTRTLKRAAGKIAITERKGSSSLAYDVTLFESVMFQERLKSAVERVFADLLHRMLARSGFQSGQTVLVVGLGNEGMVADSLGARVLSHLHIHAARSNKAQQTVLCALKSSVSGVTGLESFDVIKGLADRVKPDVVIAVDTLACSAPERLGKVIQMSDAGISPGSGVGNAKQRLNEQSVGCPVIAVGVPFVIYLKNILKTVLQSVDGSHLKDPLGKELSEMIVTLKEIDVLVSDFAEIIGRGINRAVHFLTERRI